MQKSDVLEFWRAIEAFTPAELPKWKAPADPNDRTDTEEGLYFPLDTATHMAPWGEPERMGLDPDRRWGFTLYVGVYSTADLTRCVEQLFPVRDRPQYRELPDKEAGLIAMKLGEGGLPRPESPTLSPLLWALGRNPDKGRDWLQGYEDWELEQKQLFGEFMLQAPGPLRLEALRDELGRLLDAADWPVAAVPIRRLALCRAWRHSAQEDAGEPDTPLLGSHIAPDLAWVQDACRRNQAGSALRQYLRDADPPPREDVRTDASLEARFLAPGLLLAGRWPSDPARSLALAQQLAVNQALHRLRKGGVFSVNGPPGTGKTTLLRDVVAANVVERATALTRLDDPARAFTLSGRISIPGKNMELPIYRVAPEVCGWEMVVASSNNGAVENVTRELPSAGEVDAALVGDTDYFRAAAEHLSEGASWGLLAAVLGKRENANAFVQRFWFASPSPENPDAISLRYLLRKDAPRMDWSAARDAFREALREFEREQQRLVGAEVALGRVEQLRRQVGDRARELGRLRADAVRAADEVRQRTVADEEKRREHAGARQELSTLLELRPPWWARLFRRSRVRAWKVELQSALDRVRTCHADELTARADAARSAEAQRCASAAVRRAEEEHQRCLRELAGKAGTGGGGPSPAHAGRNDPRAACGGASDPYSCARLVESALYVGAAPRRCREIRRHDSGNGGRARLGRGAAAGAPQVPPPNVRHRERHLLRRPHGLRHA
ncbi:MAG TPA: hypothetical protein VK399_15490 [Longimicrobiaceae bacterium]|nr:hypothetical protein [Longimicrobiaceae bacterium]